MMTYSVPYNWRRGEWIANGLELRTWYNNVLYSVRCIELEVPHLPRNITWLNNAIEEVRDLYIEARAEWEKDYLEKKNEPG